jgi:hypothetical protein
MDGDKWGTVDWEVVQILQAVNLNESALQST